MLSLFLGGRPRPLAPTCNICLIRNDNSTIWCEVTSSIRTRSVNEENVNAMIGAAADKKRGLSGNNSSVGEAPEEQQIKELLLCLRPIRDGNDNLVEKFKLTSDIKMGSEERKENNSNEANDVMKSRLPNKKRPLPPDSNVKGEKKTMLKKSGNEAEKSVVESLILMHKRQK